VATFVSLPHCLHRLNRVCDSSILKRCTLTSQANRPEQGISSNDLTCTSQANEPPSGRGAEPVGPSLRDQAEAILQKEKSRATSSIEALAPEEARRIIHELQVHQIEVEMQNEELRRAKAKLDAANSRYFDLYALAPFGYCTLSEAGIILEANITAANLLNVPRQSLINQPLTRFILKEDQDLYYLHHKQLQSTAELQTCELRLVRTSKSPFWARLESTIHFKDDSILEFRVVLSEITRRKEAELAFEKESIRRRIMFEQSPDGILIIDPDTKRFLEFNTAAHQQLEYSREEFAQLTIADLEVLETEEETEARIAGVLRNGKADFETLQRTKNGEVRNIHVSAQVLDIQGHPGYHCVWRDITEQKRAEISLRESEARMRAITDSAREAIIIIDQEGLVYYWNPAAERIFGYTNEEAMGMNLHMLVTPQRYHQTFKTAFAKFQHTGQGDVIDATIELQALHKDGHEISIELSLSALPHKDEWQAIGIIRDITERKRSEEALRESEERFRALHNASFGGIVIHDQGVILDCNQGLSDLTGYSRDELIGMDGLRLMAPDWREVVLQNIHGRFEQPYEAEGLRKDGTIFPVNIRGTTIPYKGRKVRATEFRDITERKQAENALRESEATIRKRLEMILEPEGDIGTLELADIIDAPALQTMIEQVHRITKIGGGVAILDIRGKVLVAVGWQDICTKFHRVHPLTSMNCKESDTVLSEGIPAGLSKAYRCKNNLWDIATPIIIGDRHLGNVFVGQFFYDDETLDYELFRRQAQQYGFNEKEYLAALDRIPRWSRESADAAMSFYGSLAKMISSLSYSTIKLARALSQKDVALHQLDESKSFQASLLETIPIPVFYKDTAGRYLGFNKAFEAFYGKNKEHLIGKTVFDIFSPELAQTYFDRDADLFKNKRSQVYQAKIPDFHGALHDVIFHKASLIDSQGVIIGLIGAIVDITERNRVEEEKKSLEKQLIQAQKMEAIGTLAGGIAHDFNNILGAIIGFSELACDSLPPGSEAITSLEKVMAAGYRASGLVKQILTFSRQSVTELTPLYPSVIIKEALKILRPSLPSTITIKQQIDNATRAILADPTEIHQILMNLCTNAFHAMESTGGILEIALSDRALSKEDLFYQPDARSGNYVVLSIGDSGPGIPPETKDKIFDPYYTTKEIGRGTGLGLSIVDGIIKKYGGFITCTSTLGIGTVFHVFFPAIEEEVVPDVMQMDTIPTGKERILFVDDEDILTELGRKVLEGLGYEVTVRTSGLKALATFRRHPNRFDAVITDHTMPGMTGMDLARQILQIHPGLPIILCTGYSTLVNEKQAKAEGIKGFAIKPLSKSLIATLLRKVLDDNRKKS